MLVRLTSTFNSTCRYEMHLGIFKIDRAIRHEAFSYLFRTEHIVYLKHNLEDFNEGLDSYRCPLLVRRFPVVMYLWGHFSMVIRMFCPTEGVSYESDSSLEAKLSISKWTCSLLLLRDLLAFCQVVRTTCGSLPVSCMTVDSLSSAPLYSGLKIHESPQPVKVSVEFVVLRSLFARADGLARQFKILEAVEKITGRAEVRLLDFQPRKAAAIVESRMSPKLIWTRALAWDWLDVMLGCKREADDLAAQPCRKRRWSAERMFKQLLVDTNEYFGISPNAGLQVQPTEGRYFCDLVKNDIILSYLQVQLKQGNLVKADAWMATAISDQLQQVPDSMEVTVVALILGFNLLLATRCPYDDENRARRKGQMRNWIGEAERYDLTDYPYLQSDLELAKETSFMLHGPPSQVCSARSVCLC